MTTYLEQLGAAPDFSVERDVVVPVVLAALGRGCSRWPRHTQTGRSPTSSPRSTPPRRGPRSARTFLGVEFPVVLGEDRDEYLRRAHEHLNVYTGLENYRSSWRRLGFGDDDFVRGGSDRLCDTLVVHGDAADVLSAVQRHVDAGADHVCLQVLGPMLDSVPAAEWSDLGGALRTR